MKYLIDIYHIPQYNLFRQTIKILGPDQVDLACVNRGKLVDIIKYECPEFKLYILGDYKNNHGRISMVLRIIIPRLFGLWKLISKNKYSVVGTASYQANIIAKLLGIPNFSVMDDPRSFVVKILKFSTHNFYLPLFNIAYGNAKSFIGLKEWAYLSPNYFNPRKTVLDKYDLKSKEYLFLREVKTDTSNYIGQLKNLILALSKELNKNEKVLLSLEDKSLISKFPDNWIILKEPLSDIHSLMYYSKMIISSGDSMAREGALLGVPSIYMGYRNMPANQVLIDKGVLFKFNLKETLAFINNPVNINQIKFRELIQNEWDDITDLIINLFKNIK